MRSEATMTTGFTRAQYDLLPEGFPAQLVQGQLVRQPAPNYGHQRLVSRLHVRLARLVGPDHALTAPTDVVIDDRNVFQADLVVLAVPPPAEANDVGVPRLAVEVASPSTRDRDRHVKTRLLLEHGVEEVWLVDPAARCIEIWSPAGMRRVRGADEARSAVLPGFRVTPAELFGR